MLGARHSCSRMFLQRVGNFPQCISVLFDHHLFSATGDIDQCDEKIE